MKPSQVDVDELSQSIIVETNEETQEAKVGVEADQFSLAIGKGGQNVRLAAKLTGWKIDITAPTGELVSQTPDGETVGDTEREKQAKEPEKAPKTEESAEPTTEEVTKEEAPKEVEEKKEEEK